MRLQGLLESAGQAEPVVQMHHVGAVIPEPCGHPAHQGQTTAPTAVQVMHGHPLQGRAIGRGSRLHQQHRHGVSCRSQRHGQFAHRRSDAPTRSPALQLAGHQRHGHLRQQGLLLPLKSVQFQGGGGVVRGLLQFIRQQCWQPGAVRDAVLQAGLQRHGAGMQLSHRASAAEVVLGLRWQVAVHAAGEEGFGLGAQRSFQPVAQALDLLGRFPHQRIKAREGRVPLRHC